MFGWWRRWRRARILRNTPISDADWHYALENLPLLDGLSAADLKKLKELAILLAHDKSVEPIGGLDLPDRDTLVLLLQAALPVLKLGLDWYDGWYSFVIYPAEFPRERSEFDEHGVVHEWDGVFSGEAWQQGGVYLSWEDVRHSGRREGYNVVIHELAHKLDMGNGAPDGFPPLHSGVDAKQWTAAFSTAYEDMIARLERGDHIGIDPYAASDPAEFFAVTSEYFFELPELLTTEYPAVYAQLRNFYRQDPLARYPSSH